MANDCLVTKLKSVVNNDNLISMDTLRIKFRQNPFNTAKSQYFKVQTTNNGITIKLIGDGYITEDISIPTTIKEITVSGGEQRTYYVSNTDCYIDIHNLNTGLRGLELGGSGDAEEFDYKEIVNIYSIKFTSYFQNLNVREMKPLDLNILPPIIDIFTMTYAAKGDFSISGVSIVRLDVRGSIGLSGTLDSALTAIKGQAKPELDIRETPNLYKKRSTITTLENDGWVIQVTASEVDENN